MITVITPKTSTPSDLPYIGNRFIHREGRIVMVDIQVRARRHLPLSQSKTSIDGQRCVAGGNKNREFDGVLPFRRQSGCNARTWTNCQMWPAHCQKRRGSCTRRHIFCSNFSCVERPLKSAIFLSLGHHCTVLGIDGHQGIWSASNTLMAISSKRMSGRHLTY